MSDAVLHEDAVHRGPAQIIPAVRRAVQAAILMANPIVLEPLLKLEVRVPQEFLGGATRVVQGRRGKVGAMESEEELAIMKSSIPVSSSFGLAADMRSETEGRALWGTEFDKFEPLPDGLANQAIKETRERKGLKPQPPTPAELID